MDLLNAVAHGITVALAFLAVITVLVAFHELGHFWFARMFGMKVNAFAVMMGGVRKTDLKEHLKKPLVPAIVPWAANGLVALLTLLAAYQGMKYGFIAGMVFLAFLGPLWVVSRINALYHVPILKGISTLFSCYGVGLVILGFATGFRNVDVSYALSLMLGAAAVGVMLSYYRPVLGTEQPDGKKGFGQVDIDGIETPVRFRPVWHTTSKSGTEYSLLLLPLGGFADIAGMAPKEDGSEVNYPNGFYSRPPWQRLLVLFAGPLFSVILGVGLLTATFAIQGKLVGTNVVESLPDGPAKTAGLLPGDKIVAINGKPVSKHFDIVNSIRFSYDETPAGIVSRPVAVGFERAGQRLEATITPIVSDKPRDVLDENGEPVGAPRRQALIGVLSRQDYIPQPVGTAFFAAVTLPWEMAVETVQTFTNIDKAKENVGGPTATVEATSAAVKQGPWSVIRLAGLLSIVLGIMNLIPVPPLDGGQMLVAFVEMLRGNRRVSLQFQNILFTAGSVFIAALMLFAITMDATRRASVKAPETSTESGPIRK